MKSRITTTRPTCARIETPADASRTRLLEAAGLSRASLLVITFDHYRALERILQRMIHFRKLLQQVTRRGHAPVDARP